MGTIYMDGTTYQHADDLTVFLDHITMLGYRLVPLAIALDMPPPDDHPVGRVYFAVAFASDDAVRAALVRISNARAASPQRDRMSAVVLGRCHCVEAEQPSRPAHRFVIFWDNVHGRVSPLG